MSKHLYSIVISTFLFGLLTGVIVFLMSHTGTERSSTIAEPTRGYSIVVRMYGGCERLGGGVCPSYRVAQNGEYTYLRVGTNAEITQHRGTFESAQRTALQNAFTQTNLAQLETSTFQGNCPAHVDGVSFRYEVTSGSSQYSLDSCLQNIQNEALFKILENNFKLLMHLYETAP